MRDSVAPGGRRLARSAWFLLFLFLELAVFAILPLSARLPIGPLLYFQVALTIVLVLGALWLRRSTAGNVYWHVAYALFVGSAAVLVGIAFSDRLVSLFRLAPETPAWMAVAKLSESVLRVPVILGLTAMVGAGAGSLYLRKGKLAFGLLVGVAGFVGFAALAFVPLASHAGAADKVLSMWPWIAIFVLANGFTEELLFRGLFLQRYETFLGPGLSNLLAAVVFTLVHVQVGYVSQMLQFLVVLFPLALVWGYLMQRSGALWCSALVHAGADCLIILSIFAGR